MTRNKVSISGSTISELVVPFLVASIFVISTVDVVLPGYSMSANIFVRTSLVLILLLYIFFSNKEKYGIRLIQILPILFLLLYVFRLVFDANKGGLERNPVSHYFYYTIIGSLLPLFGLLFIKNINYDKIGKILFYILLICGVVFLLNFKNILGTDFGRISRDDTGVNPLIVGYMGTFLFVLSFSLFKSHKVIGLKKTILYLGVVVGFLCIALSGSRGPTIATFFPLLIYSFYNYESYVKRFGLTMLLVAFGIIAVIILESIGSTAYQRIIGTYDRIDAGREIRFFRYFVLYDLITSNLLFGYGTELPGGSSPHNLILESFLALGVFGGTLFMILYLIGVLTSIKLIKYKVNIWLAMLFLSVSIWALLSSTIYYLTPFWVILLLILKNK